MNSKGDKAVSINIKIININIKLVSETALLFIYFVIGYFTTELIKDFVNI